MDAVPVNTASGRFISAAASMKAAGAPVRDIVQALLDEGAKQLDIVRAVMRAENVDIRRARELIEETGLLPPDHGGLTVVIPEDDPWYKQVSGEDG
jgi:hypothetical protein